MRKTLFFLFCVLILPVTLGLATPPPPKFLGTSITLTYDLSKGSCMWRQYILLIIGRELCAYDDGVYVNGQTSFNH